MRGQVEVIFDAVWAEHLRRLFRQGDVVAPRGMRTIEYPQYTTVADMKAPVLRNPLRKLNYKFMAAEAYWILSGDDTVAGIEPYNKNIAQFSDDGETFFGAYGPRIREQLDWVIWKLCDDQDTRQAGLTIWRERPPKSKDIPCTVAIWFQIRDGRVNAHVFMRSSDVWLGLPYDVFNFSMLGCLVTAKLNELRYNMELSPGRVYVTAASSHLYERDQVKARDIANMPTDFLQEPEVPPALYKSSDALMMWLRDLRKTKRGSMLRWWEGNTDGSESEDTAGSD